LRRSAGPLTIEEVEDREEHHEPEGSKAATQKALRDANRRAKRPDRDDVARVALFWLIRRAIEKGQQMELEKFQNKIVSMLTLPPSFIQF
jgi:hypothetical protein